MKRVKDPVYGYIDIHEDIMRNIIDCPEFQRLRGVVQTSYSVLYPSTLHNRFVHSLGVFFLGCKAMKVLLSESDVSTGNMLEKYRETFELACLLHDVGHAPFSHTGEIYFLKEDSRDDFHEKICVLSDDSVLKEEIRYNGYKAAPHELMSAIIGLEVFGSNIRDDQKGFFVRCITGYKYTKGQLTYEQQLQNCLVELLNSRIIDVDKIDYLIRDSYMSGFEAPAVDYDRLILQMRIEKDAKDDTYKVIFTKNGLSVVENVVFAHDLERKWIQNHPTVLYDTYLLKRALEDFREKFFVEENCLPYQMLSEKGVKRKDTGDMIRLASDSDIVYLMKNIDRCDVVSEYYDRRKRKHPLWKSEEEFRAIFSGQKDMQGYLNILDEMFSGIEKSQRREGIVINQEALINMESDIKLAEDNLKSLTERLGVGVGPTIELKKAQLRLIKIFEEFAQDVNIDFDFLILYADEFSSGFEKPEFGGMLFKLPSVKGYHRFDDISNLLKQNESEREKYFFIYCKKDACGETPSFSILIKKLIEFAGEININRQSNVIGNRVSS